MSSFTLHDHYFDPGSEGISSYFCRLFILIGPESLQYAMLDTEKNSFIALADYRLPAAPKSQEAYYAQIDQLMGEEVKLVKKYPSVVIGMDTPWHTLVPSSLYDTGQMAKYMEFNFRLPGNCGIGSDRLDEIDAYNIYGFSPGLKDVIRRHYSDAAIVHRSSSLIRAVYQHHQANPVSSALFLNIRDQFIDITSFDGNRPAFFNSFSYRSKEDVLYFTLYTFEQLKLRPDAAQLFISGQDDTGSDLCLLLEQYIRTVSFTGRLGAFNYSPLLNQVPAHYYNELYALALCGS